ncbi:MAG: formate dehydrogenase accessory sulfurtransferase FdhD [bacterium]|jgi:FdhD protein
MKLAVDAPILRYEDGQTRLLDDPVVVEYRLAVWLNGAPWVNLLCSPQDLDVLVLGYLYGEGIIKTPDDILSIALAPEDGIARVTVRGVPEMPAQAGPITAPRGAGRQHAMGGAGPGRPAEPLSGSLNFAGGALLRNLRQFYADSGLHRLTAGVHRAALCDDNGILLTAIDISRHNAFDKVLGMALRQNIPLECHYLITSGRVPSDMVNKAITARLPMLVSRAAPTDWAIRLAREANMTLLGFSRENRFNIYTGAHRVNM